MYIMWIIKISNPVFPRLLGGLTQIQVYGKSTFLDQLEEVGWASRHWPHSELDQLLPSTSFWSASEVMILFVVVCFYPSFSPSSLHPPTHPSIHLPIHPLSIIHLKQEEGGRPQPLKEWHNHWGYDINWLEPTRSKMAEDLTYSWPWASLYAHCNTIAYAKQHTHRCHDSSEAKRGWWPNSWRSPPLPQNIWNNPPTY